MILTYLLSQGWGDLGVSKGELSSVPQVQQKMDDIEEKETEVFDWRKKVTEAECKLKQAENLVESVLCERNLYSKNLIESQVRMHS